MYKSHMGRQLYVYHAALLFAAVLPGADATIEVDAARKAAYRIPRTVYGTFLEPIGKSIYPGLWAQIIENPSFEDDLWSADQIRRMVEQEPALVNASRMGLPLPWEPLDTAQGSRYEPRWKDAANSFRSLLIMALPGKQTGVRQQVHLPVHRVLRYSGSLYVKPVGSPAEIEVSLRKRNRADQVLARASVQASGGEWKRHEFALELARGAVTRLEAVDLVIALKNEQRALVDQVFLFPADHEGGMDPDMIALCRDLKTPLVRYGGNFTS